MWVFFWVGGGGHPPPPCTGVGENTGETSSITSTLTHFPPPLPQPWALFNKGLVTLDAFPAIKWFVRLEMPYELASVTFQAASLLFQ